MCSIESAVVSGQVFDIQRFSIHDGPGIRTTVFLKGCPLHCLWCHNPEGREERRQLAFTPALCIGCQLCASCCAHSVHRFDNGSHNMERSKCAECFACVETCYANALEAIGKALSVDEVLEEVEKDRPFYEESGGGLTVSGGEPLAQPVFVRELLREARARGLHTCVETSGFAPTEHLAALLSFVDLFLFDYKETDPERHREYTGHSNELILQNLRFLDDQGASIILRCPIVPDINLRDDHLRGIAATAASLRNCQATHVLAYHALGDAKRTRLGQVLSQAQGRGACDMRRDDLERVVSRIRELGGKNVLLS